MNSFHPDNGFSQESFAAAFGKKEGNSCFSPVWQQTCQKNKLFKCEAISFPSLGSKSFLDNYCLQGTGMCRLQAFMGKHVVMNIHERTPGSIGY